jgi:hypothetical protein
MWLTGHYYEHENFRVACLKLTDPIVIPEYDILSWRDDPEFVQSWLQNHEAIHEAIRTVTNVNGVDLSLVDLGQDEQWYEWLDDHSQEHILFRQVLNVG